MSTQSITPRKNDTTKPESRFQRLWAEASNLAQENLNLETELDALVQRVDKEVLQLELEMGKTIQQVVHRQLDFAQKKSLLKWQRAELDEWIDDNLAELSAMGLIDEALQNKLAALKAAELGIQIDPDSEMSAVDQLEKHLEEDAAEFRQQMENEDDELFGSEAEMFGDDDDSSPDEDDLDEDDLAELLRRLNAEFGDEHPFESPGQHSAAKPVDDAVFKRLFRQTAAALHPDKESDEGRRQEKHELMSQLLKARKDYDLITLLRLHEEHAKAASGLDANDEQALEQILVEYLNQQQQRMEEIVHQSPVHHLAFTRFYHKKPATVTRLIKTHVLKIEQRRESLSAFIKQVKTLKTLKQVLTERYDAQLIRRGWR